MPKITSGVASAPLSQVDTPLLAVAAVPEARTGVSARDLGQAAVEGVAQGAWAFTELKATPDEPKPEVEGLTFVCDQKEMKEVATGQRVGDAVAAGHGLTRNLQMLPGNVCTPSYLAERAKQLADQYGFTLTVLDRAKLEQEGMGALLAVAQGSDQEPRFIVLEHRGGGDAAPVALVGKGVTFDSGGISIKPAQNMEDMKFDMSGAAAVLGTFETLGLLKPKVNVVGLIPATENLPSGHAVKPGDVVKSHFGKTIEIINTDAEGRLILCDALSYVRRFKPAAVIDIATLTGAVVVALGQVAMGAMGNDEALLAEVREAGERAGERCWPLALWGEYRGLLKSDISGVKNSGGRGAGSVARGGHARPRHPAALSPRIPRSDPRRAAAARHALYVQRRLARALERPDAVGSARPYPGRVHRARRHLRRRGDRVLRGARRGRARDLLGRRAVPAARARLGVPRPRPHLARTAPAHRRDRAAGLAPRLPRHAAPTLHRNRVAGRGRHVRGEDGELPRRVSPPLALGTGPLARRRLQQHRRNRGQLELGLQRRGSVAQGRVRTEPPIRRLVSDLELALASQAGAPHRGLEPPTARRDVTAVRRRP